MLYRLIAQTLLMVCLTLPASAALYPGKAPDDALASAAARLKVRDFAGARQAALRSSNDKGAKAFLVGFSSAKLELWEEAARELGEAALSFPVLADYALYYRGVSLAKLGRNDEALTPLMKVLKEYRESRLARPAMILYADTLLAGGYLKEALESYQNFIDRYPSGSDSLSALLGSALCQERLGNPAEAVAILKRIWLNYPASPVAEKASQELSRLALQGVAVAPYQSAELVKRANTLFDLGRYPAAVAAFAELSQKELPAELNCKVRLKQGQALVKARRYRDAEEVLRTVAAGSCGVTCSAEANLWLGRALDNRGKEEEAFALFMRLADSPQLGPVADDALLKAAYLKRFQRKWQEALPLFKRYVANHPDPARQGSALWESAWACFQARDYSQAAIHLRKLSERPETREKALYWLGKALLASGDKGASDAQFAQLSAEYPFGFYALTSNQGAEVGQVPRPPRNLVESLPIPAGFEREKTLISLGLYEEAAKELSGKKGRNPFALARLYLEMENFNGAFHAAGQGLSRADRESAQFFGLRYPLAFREHVAKNAAANGIPESLVYAVMHAESNYSPTALSPVGAVGLMQIMPATAEQISKGDSVRLTKPELNIRLGTRHLKELLTSYQGNIPLAAAAYNAGAGNVKRWQRALGDLPQDEFIESIPFAETREYVKKVVSIMALYQRLYQLPGAKQVSPTPDRGDLADQKAR